MDLFSIDGYHMANKIEIFTIWLGSLQNKLADVWPVGLVAKKVHERTPLSFLWEWEAEPMASCFGCALCLSLLLFGLVQEFVTEEVI